MKLMIFKPSNIIAFVSCLSIALASSAQLTSKDRTCIPIGSNIINVAYPVDSVTVSKSNPFLVSLPLEFKGKIERNLTQISDSNLRITLTKACGAEIELTPIRDKDSRQWTLYPDRNIPPGLWTLNIPEGYFKIVPEIIEVADIDVDLDSLRTLSVGGGWHVDGTPVKRQGIFTIQDDDGITGKFLNLPPKDCTSWGYFTTLYPVLESLGLKGTISLEGRKAGFTDNPPVLNETGLLAKRLQDERGWEVQNHSMYCAGENLSCWYVDNLECDLAKKLLSEGENLGLNNYNTVSVYDGETGRQYMPDEQGKSWVEVYPEMVKPYVGNYSTKKAIFYDENFDVDYHWGAWFHIADQLGIEGKSWVSHNIIASHALTPRINEFCRYGFADNALVTYNVPPLMSTATRCNLEGQQLPGYKGTGNADNTYDYSEIDFYRKQLHEACEKGGWIVFALHTYRKCWKNYLPGSLVSEGGTYPDAWVLPLSTINPLEDPLTPPAALGISSWSEWHPCPGTRLYMIWELFKEARDLGMLCVTSAEGHEKIGNKESTGYFSNGLKIGYDQNNIAGVSEIYPHFFISADGEKSYFNPIYSEEINIENIVSDGGNISLPEGIYSPDGKTMPTSEIKRLTKGIWIINGKKYLITK